jgi:hypothetical protein
MRRFMGTARHKCPLSAACTQGPAGTPPRLLAWQREHLVHADGCTVRTHKLKSMQVPPRASAPTQPRLCNPTPHAQPHCVAMPAVHVALPHTPACLIVASVDHMVCCSTAGVACVQTGCFCAAQEHEGLEQGPLYDPRLGPRHHSNGSPEALLEEMKFNVTAQARRADRTSSERGPAHPMQCGLHCQGRVCPNCVLQHVQATAGLQWHHWACAEALTADTLSYEGASSMHMHQVRAAPARPPRHESTRRRS